MCKIISIINQKGGVGKTTTCTNLAVSLVQLGKKVLVIDLDSQANFTMGMGYENPDEIEIKLADLLYAEISKRTGTSGNNQNQNNDTPKEQYILSAHRVDFIPSGLDLAGLELTLMNTIGRETVLKGLVGQFKDDYDYILIDCLPSLGIFTVNALTASDEIIIPVQAQYFGAKGVEALLQSVMSVQKYLNPSLKIAGILTTMLDGRSTFQKEVRQIVTDSFGDYAHMFNTTIPLSVDVSRMQSQGLPIVLASNNPVANAYHSFALEVMSNE